MKVEVKEKEDYEAQQYKFKPRAFKMENIIETNISSLGSSFASESFSEWQELISEDESTEKVTSIQLWMFVCLILILVGRATTR